MEEIVDCLFESDIKNMQQRDDGTTESRDKEI